MGQCGCGDFSAEMKLPGPSGSFYAIQFYHPCSDCGTGAAVIVHRFTEKEAKSWGVPDLPEPPWVEYGEAAEHWIQVLDPGLLKERMKSFAKANGADYDPEGLVEDAVDHCLDDAIEDTRAGAEARQIAAEEAGVLADEGSS